MKIIFLDVDGVLNSLEDLMIYREKNNIKGSILYDVVEDRPLKLLKEIVEKTGAKIVVSSTWRIGYNRTNEGNFSNLNLCEKLERRLQEYGMDIYDVTPDFRGEKQRGDEIRDWLSKNDVSNFIILDDDSDMCEYADMPNFIQTSFDCGLTEELKDRAIEVLNGDYSSGRF